MRELGLRSIVRRRKPVYSKGQLHQLFPNLLNQQFDVDQPNHIWVTDFTYLPMPGGSMRYNCTILDLYDRCVMATCNGEHITAELACITLQKALDIHKPEKGLILHSDQGAQFTSETFVLFCQRHAVQQSMSRAGCPYDNAPMERFYNTLKNEYFNLRRFKDVKSMNEGLYWFVYCHYNRCRPHSYNNGLTPYAARMTA